MLTAHVRVLAADVHARSHMHVLAAHVHVLAINVHMFAAHMMR